MRGVRLTALAALIIFSVTSISAFALTADQVLVVYNSQELPDPSSPDYPDAREVIPASEGVARYYASQRGIPEGNLLGLPLAPFRYYATPNQFSGDLATPISDYLSTHPSIRVIVMCYGVPSHISCDDQSNPWRSVDSCLTCLGNENALQPAYFLSRYTNPYKSACRTERQSFTEFRKSPDNSIVVAGGLHWKMNYLVCRLDGYSTPTTEVTVNNVQYDIPSDVKALIDRATAANSLGRSNLTGAKVVLDDAPNGANTVRQYPASTEASLNALLEPLTGVSDNVWRDPTLNTYLTNRQNLIAYSSNGSYDDSALPVTTWWRPFNTEYKEGAIGVFWSVSGDGYSIRTPRYVHPWASHSDTEDVEAHTLKATWKNYFNRLETSSLYDGHWLCLRDYQTHALLKRVNFSSGVARMGLSDVQWPASHQTYIELRFPDDDPKNPGDLIDRPTPIYLPLDAIYNARSTGYTWRFDLVQSLASDLLRDGCSAATANAGEPAPGNVADPNIIFPSYFSGYTWAESAWMGIPEVQWQQVALGDPLMARFWYPPTVVFKEPSPADGYAVSGPVPLSVELSSPLEEEFQVTFRVVNSGGTSTTIGTASQHPWFCRWDTSQYADGAYTLVVDVTKTGGTAVIATVSRQLVVANATNPQVVIARPDTDIQEDKAPIPVIATRPVDAPPAQVQFWRFVRDEASKIGDAVTVNPDARAYYQTVATADDFDLQAIALDAANSTAAYSQVRYVHITEVCSSVTLCPKVADAATQPEGTNVFLQAAPVTALWTPEDPKNGDVVFYLEDTNRVTGIRALAPSSMTVTCPSLVALRGIMHQDSTEQNPVAERYIEVQQVWELKGPLQVIPAEIPAPLAIGNGALGGLAPPSTSLAISDPFGPYNTGLLVRCFGRVTGVGTDFLYIDDGSVINSLTLNDGNGAHLGLRVSCPGLSQPAVDDYVLVTGISSIWLHGGIRSRLLLPRTQNDIIICGHYVPPESGGSGMLPEGTFGTENVDALVFDPLAPVDLRPGSIGWALAQPDGTVVSLQCESVTAISDGGCSVALKEWYDPDTETPRLVLQLPWATSPEPWNQIDIINGTLGTLPNGQRVITDPEAVYRRLGPNGLPVILVPKDYSDDGQPELWPWPEAVYTR